MKLKTQLYTICILLTSMTLQSCLNILDSTSRNDLTDPTVWGNKEAIEAYLGDIYNQMETESFGYMVLDKAGYPSQLTDEAVRAYTSGTINNTIISESAFAWWKYDVVRESNLFIEKIQESSLKPEEIVLYSAQARFIRAFHYFALVKRYGGVPIITVPQSITNPTNHKTPRSKEEEVYEFIKTEIDDIVKDLPATWNHSVRFKATKYAAYALKSRAMLYAGSIATYGTVQKDGLVGIPMQRRAYFFNESLKASEEIINSGKFKLYDQKLDKSLNYQELFLDKTMHDELIFSIAYSSPNKGHSWDYYNAPYSFKVNYGSATNPTLQFVDEYENVDGSDGRLVFEDETGQPILYNTPYEAFKDKDPRLSATVLLPFAPWQNNKIEIRNGIIDGDLTITAPNTRDTYGTGEAQITIIGKDGMSGSNDFTKTGFYIKKFMNPTDRVDSGRSEVNWMVFRYAEILLNYAEASAELDINEENSILYINMIRSRAGIKHHMSLDLEKIRKERKIELAFENHRWWDMKRWRISTEVLNNYAADAISIYLIWEDGKLPSEMKYIIKKTKANKPTKTFLPKLYYVKIPTGLTSSHLEQNPGY